MNAKLAIKDASIEKEFKVYLYKTG